MRATGAIAYWRFQRHLHALLNYLCARSAMYVMYSATNVISNAFIYMLMYNTYWPYVNIV